MALLASDHAVQIREVLLRDKPQQLLDVSPNETVPVLVLDNGDILDESLDIMLWALKDNDKLNWLRESHLAKELIDENDHAFKENLDKYKYADRYPEHPVAYYQEQVSPFLEKLNLILSKKTFLVDNKISFVDVALFPFIRQCAYVDKSWFDSMPWSFLQKWLAFFLESGLFLNVMGKLQPWKEGDEPLYFPNDGMRKD